MLKPEAHAAELKKFVNRPQLEIIEVSESQRDSKARESFATYVDNSVRAVHGAMRAYVDTMSASSGADLRAVLTKLQEYSEERQKTAGVTLTTGVSMDVALPKLTISLQKAIKDFIDAEWRPVLHHIVELGKAYNSFKAFGRLALCDVRQQLFDANTECSAVGHSQLCL